MALPHWFPLELLDQSTCLTLVVLSEEHPSCFCPSLQLQALRPSPFLALEMPIAGVNRLVGFSMGHAPAGTTTERTCKRSRAGGCTSRPSVPEGGEAAAMLDASLWGGSASVVSGTVPLPLRRDVPGGRVDPGWFGGTCVVM